MAETSKTVDNALAVLEAIADVNGITVAALAKRLGLSWTVVHRLVSTLVARGYVTRDEDGACAIGEQVHRLGRGAGQFTDLAEAQVRALAKEHGETFLVSIFDGNGCRAIAQGIGDQYLVRVEYRIGEVHPLHLGASGRAILAFLDADQRARQLTDLSVSERATIEIQLADTRQLGHAISHSELSPGIDGVSVPVIDSTGVIASVTAVVPSARSAVLIDLVPGLRRAADALGAGAPVDSSAPVRPG